MTDGLRPAPRGKLGAPVHRQELVAESVMARIDGVWVPADIIAQRQTRPDAPWEVCLQYTPRRGSNCLGWFVADPQYLREDEPGSD
ncbi:hypothetical protein [Streptodolium elevatio]|uniref:Uncharacterized protein n=1 Tax=Streptodolium elevatio TaxID=3157996 RepID=A0ABV3DK65_9ACTN